MTFFSTTFFCRSKTIESRRSLPPLNERSWYRRLCKTPLVPSLLFQGHNANCFYISDWSGSQIELWSSRSRLGRWIPRRKHLRNLLKGVNPASWLGLPSLWNILLGSHRSRNSSPVPGNLWGQLSWSHCTIWWFRALCRFSWPCRLSPFLFFSPKWPWILRGRGVSRWIVSYDNKGAGDSW